ncbi:hypothetical protein [Blastochloris tepida]|uniref:Uncharacterized protein n=1 Tax=Blastochloris tepida TaxID=2233851 RepID=A0A348G1Q7_9HYPH|nr:hypothetical protein [Blastochloris tepida]BBF93490.1 hypothetical protein BLTE_21750 [Blastochloris tepida]
MKQGYLLIGLLAATIIVSAILFTTNPDMAQRYAEMRREATLSEDVQNVVMLVIALGVGGYLGWHYLKRD